MSSFAIFSPSSRPSRSFATLLLLGSVAFLPAAATAQSPGPDTIVAALTEDIRGSDPRRERSGLSDDVHFHVVEGLMGFRDDLTVAPMLAESVAVEDEGATYRFTLREGVRFHNGAPLTAEAVKWSWDYLMAEDSAWRCRNLFTGELGLKVEALETPDERTVVFRLNQPDGNFLYTLARTDCAQTPVLHPDSVNADGSWNKPIGTGPFTIGERRIGEWIEIHRFADYSPRDDEPSGMVGRKEALIETVRFLIVPDTATRQIALQSGSIDIAVVPGQTAEELRKTGELQVVSADTTAWYTLLVNDANPALADKRLRQAIAYAIDRQAVADAVTFGQSKGHASPMPPLSSFYSEAQAKDPGYDPDKAMALLAEAGYAGEPIVMVANKRFPLMFDNAVLIQSMLQAVGLNVQLEVLEWGLQLDLYMKNDFQLQSFAYSGRYEPLGSYERIIGPETRKIWKSEETTTLLKSGERSVDPAVIQQTADELYRRFVDEVPAVGLFHFTMETAASKRLEGVRASPIEALMLWNVAIAK